MTTEILVFLMFFGLIIGVLMGFPIAFTLLGVAIAVGYLGVGSIVVLFTGYRVNAVVEEWIFVAIPLFVFIGCMMERSGMADNAFGALDQWTRKIKGGLGITTVIICVIFAACIGFPGASVSTIGLISLAPMIDRGYSKELATGIVAAGGVLGMLLPPSIVLVLFSTMLSMPMLRLFLAAAVPGLLLALFYLLYAWLIGYFKKNAIPDKIQNMNLPKKYTFWGGLWSFLPFVILILTILGTIYFGIATLVEASGLGAIASIFLAICYKKFSGTVLMDAAKNTVKVTSMVVFLALGATMFTSVFFIIGGRAVVRNLVLDSGLGPFGVFILFLVLVFVMGIFMDWMGVCMILVPIFVPILESLGFDPIHVSVVVLALLQTSFLTPPFAQGVFYTMAVAPHGVTINDAYRGAIPFICIQLIVVVICIMFPNLVMVLSNNVVVGW